MSEKETVIALSKKWAVEQKKFNNCTFDCALELFILFIAGQSSDTSSGTAHEFDGLIP